MQKRIWLFGFGLGALLFGLKYLEYRFLVKQISIELLMGIIAVFFTLLGIWFSRNWQKKQVQKKWSSEEIQQHFGISDREMDVLHGIDEGLSNQEIAAKLFLSENTIKTHSSNLFQKLAVNRRTQAISKARKVGLIH